MPYLTSLIHAAYVIKKVFVCTTMASQFHVFRKRVVASVLFACTMPALSFFAVPVRADEVWMSEGKMIQWLESKGSTAVFQMNNVYIYIEGLASASSNNRGTYTGYWVTPTNFQNRCATFREYFRGQSSYTWGRFKIKFIGNTTPYKWSAKLGECDFKAYRVIEAVPMMQAN